MPASGRRLYLDTFVFMDILSGKKDIADKAASYLKTSKSSSDVVSSIVLSELYFHIKRRGSREKADEILSFIQSLPNLEIAPVTSEIATVAGRLRAKYFKKIQKNLSYFDCIHIATAVAEKCDVFVTGDRGFREIEDIEVEIY